VVPPFLGKARARFGRQASDDRKNSLCQVGCAATERSVPTPIRGARYPAAGSVEALASVDDFAHESALDTADTDVLHAAAVLDGVVSTVECPDYPQPPEAWWAWPHYQKGI
jgi:hypothetical protein